MKKATKAAEEFAKEHKEITGYVIWPRWKTPMEDHQCIVFRHMSDAEDELREIYGEREWRGERWRIAPLTMCCQRARKPRA